MNKASADLMVWTKPKEYKGMVCDEDLILCAITYSNLER